MKWGDIMKNEKPNCYECEYRGSIAGNAHSKCVNKYAKVKGHEHGIR